MIHYITHQLFLDYAEPEMTIIELGDQLMDIGEDTQFERSDVYYRSRFGYNIQSIDIHGKNRALPIDLSLESDQVFEADLVTNFGTIEHVSDLYNALLNCHNWTKESGIMIHSNPKTGTFAGHGHWFFTMEFWKAVCLANNYRLIETMEIHPYSDTNPDVEVVAVYQKMNSEP